MPTTDNSASQHIRYKKSKVLAVGSYPRGTIIDQGTKMERDVGRNKYTTQSENLKTTYPPCNCSP